MARGRSGWPRTVRREINGQKWMGTWVWDKASRRMVWEFFKWAEVGVWGVKSQGWEYWGRFLTITAWKQAVAKENS